MEILISSVIWSIGAYFTSKKIKNQYKDLEINPISYGVGTLFFGFLLTMSFLGWKVSKHTNNKTSKLISLAVFILTIIFNLFILI